MSGADPRRRTQLAAKRTIDVLAALALLVLLGPTIVALAVAVAATSPGGPFFHQLRAGVGGRPFTIHKLRTMSVDGERRPGEAYSFEQTATRVTRVGKLLRRLSLDELPQLVNILKGEMSLVGPRPDLLTHAERYSPFQRQRLAVRPGITGWAQIHGRNRLTWEQRIRLDVAYIERWSLALDMRILLSTASIVLKGKGADLPRHSR
jgi:lipopolysaccharide/colanic/teichoic acid biosynthesis glycosyltransferase